MVGRFIFDKDTVNFGDETAKQVREHILDLPDDLEAWVNEGYEDV